MEGYRQAAQFDYDNEAKTFLERELGLEQANQHHGIASTPLALGVPLVPSAAEGRVHASRSRRAATWPDSRMCCPTMRPART